MYETVTNLNTMDFLMAVVMATIICIGVRSGIITEFLKLFGIFCTIFIALHYYERFADFLRVQFFGKDASTVFVAFSILAVLIFVIFTIVSRGWVLILKIKSYPAIDRYGGLFFSLVQSYFTCGLIFFALLLAKHDYATPKARQSMSSVIFRYVAADFYRASYSVLIKDFFPNEEINEEAFKLTVEKAKKRTK